MVKLSGSSKFNKDGGHSARDFFLYFDSRLFLSWFLFLIFFRVARFLSLNVCGVGDDAYLPVDLFLSFSVFLPSLHPFRSLLQHTSSVPVGLKSALHTDRRTSLD